MNTPKILRHARFLATISGSLATFGAPSSTSPKPGDLRAAGRVEFPISGAEAVLKGFTPGTTISGRVRKIGKGGEVGEWSDPAQVMAT
jgi:hypothetical protein